MPNTLRLVFYKQHMITVQSLYIVILCANRQIWSDYIIVLVVNYGISNTIVLEIP